LTGQQGHELAMGITDDRMDKGLFDSAAAFQSDAMGFDYEIQSIARAVAGRLQSMNRRWSSRRSKPRELIHVLKSWLTRHFQKSSRAMGAALNDGRFQRGSASRTTSVPSIQRIPKLAATLGSSGAVRNSIHPPGKAWPFLNQPASISSKSKFPVSLPLNLCVP
jgi:hypothetical protein